MAAELFRVRSKFIEKVSKEMISQLLDDLLEDSILNDGEREAILEEHQSRVERARALIDPVRKKGDVASRKMIARLQARDPTLFSELGLSAGQPAQPAQLAQPAQPAQLAQPAQPAAEPGEEQGWSDKLILTTEDFWKQKQNDKSVYPAGKSNIRNRVALLITNIKFKEEKRNRKGAEKDEENMEKLLSALGYEVVRHTNLTAKEIDEALIKFSKHPKLKETDSVVVVLMSHGKLGAVLGVDSTEEQPDDFPIDKIYKHLGSEKCPALLNKPKVIIIQACRGECRGSVIVEDSAKQAVVCDDVNQPGPSDDDMEEDTVRCVHKEKDFVSLLSSTPDTVSYRQTENGSFLIQYIVEVFNTYAHTDDIEELFRKVMQRFEDFASGNRRQMATKDRCTLTRRFYFFPGI
ncbi:caspase a-like [Mugil cephalus]|uniref:caspase a-like n=1 Tax=Mugil cephalus TaxID=48193 RepID=UPI001FB571BA|nr:caspase a-like [Mugil cephalus]